MQKGAETVHAANPDILVILSGLNYDKDFSFLQQKPLSLTFTGKLVYEVHWYGFSDGQAWATSNPNQVCGQVVNNIMRKAGFVLDQGYPLFVTEFGVDLRGTNVNDNRYLNCFMGWAAELDLDWALWTLVGSYYLREGAVGLDENYGIYNWNWCQTRNSSFLEKISALQSPFQGPGVSEGRPHKIIFHPSTGQCVQRKSFFKPLELGPCSEAEAWGYSPQKILTIKGTYYCLQADELGQPAKLCLICTDINSKWEAISDSKMHLSSKLHDGTDVEGTSSYSPFTFAMSRHGFGSCYSHSSVSTEEDFLMRKILMTHDPDGCQLDSRLLLRAIKNIFHCANPISKADSDPENEATSICDAEAIGLQDSLEYTIIKISHEVLSRCFEEGDIHTKTMFLFDMLGKFKWDAKLILVLAGFFTHYGVFELIVQLQSHDPLAALVALLRQVPCSLSGFRAQFKAFTLLVKTIVEVTEIIIEFESLPLQQELLEYKTISVVKSKIYMASYWILRSSLACFSMIKGLRTTKHDQVPSFAYSLLFSSPWLCSKHLQNHDIVKTLTMKSNFTTTGVWTMFSLVYRLSALCSDLKAQMETCHQQIGTRLYEKLLNLFKQTDIDNQENLQMLIPFVDNFPLKDCLSNEKHSISELKNKVVIFLVSKPELLPIEKIFLLVQQTYDHPHQEKIGGSYVIIWVPISSSHAWSRTDYISFHFLTNSLPFWSLKQPWFLNSAVVNFIKQEWNFKEEAMMVVLDTNGMITNSNAIDMIWIWGAKAFPFSILREKELWELESWTLKLIINGIDPLLTKLIDEGKNLCIYGSDNMDWVRTFSAKIKEMKNTGLQLEVIYAGWRNPSEKLRKFLDIIEQEKLSTCLTFTEIFFFWHRLERMEISVTRQENASGFDGILKEILGLLEDNNNADGWMLIGTGSLPGLVKLQGKKATECIDLFPVWAEKVGTLGLVGAIKSALEPPLSISPCNHYDILAYDEGLKKGTVFCSVCNRPMEKFVLYKCEASEQ